MRPAPAPGAVAALALALLAAAAGCGGAPDRGDAVVDRPELEAGLAPAEAPRLEAKLERTILGIDVLRVTVRFGPETTAELREIVRRSAREGAEDDTLADAAAAAALGSGNVLVQVDLLRDVPLDKFLEATRKNLGIAARSGRLSRTELETVSGRLRPWFSFLAERGLREGDRLSYRIRGDTVRTVYVGRDGYTLLDQTDPHAPELRSAILGGYLAEGVGLREKLLESLFARAIPRRGAPAVARRSPG